MLIENFAYPKLLKYFEEISAIPRPSYHEEKIADYLVEFAQKRGLEYYRDALNNVLIDLPATEGREKSEPILLQGHTDMVCEKNEGVAHDFLADPLKLYVKDGWIRAEGTTLGADDGVAVAAMLALLDGACESHGRVQCLFTASEEVGLDGVKGFDYSRIFARKMINMDSADESLIIAGCAGGLRSSVTLPVERYEQSGEVVKVQIGGLAGGHSGEDIHRGRANANKLLGRVLNRLFCENSSARLISVSGGTKENAIPRESTAYILCGGVDSISALCKTLHAEISAELCADDKGFFLSVSPAESKLAPMTRECGDRIIFLLLSLSNGVFEMNRSLSGIVEFSRNLGIIKTEADSFEAVVNSRSAIESQLDLSAAELDAYARIFGGVSDHYNRYPGWEYAESSEIRKAYTRAYSALYGKEPTVEVIHAGLECGLIKKALPDMDMLSCGPIVLNLHSPDEALDVASFERFFGVILKVLSDM
ncbi:MAG: beta-Ala-His dipeptidase [Clostridia bacterium]|nr:beta-Ala-His dipeptidase [Clostridia bacterium]